MILLSTLVQESLELPQRKREEISEQACPACGSKHLIKNGSSHNGKSKHQCKNCSYQFVNSPTKTTVSLETKQLIDRLLLEKISLRGIARVTQVSWSWLQVYVNQRLARTPRQIEVSVKSPGRLTIECDEMWSFVNSKKNDVYIWLAIDRDSRKIGLYRLCYANVAADTNSGYAAPSDSVTWFARNRSRKLLRFGRSIHPRS